LATSTAVVSSFRLCWSASVIAFLASVAALVTVSDAS